MRFMMLVIPKGYETAAPDRAPDAKQVEQIKASFNERVAKASAQELQFILDDMDAKFKLLDTKEAQDTRAWMAQYLSLLADKKRDEVVRKLPNPIRKIIGDLSDVERTLVGLDLRQK